MNKAKIRLLNLLMLMSLLTGALQAQETITGKTVEKSTGNIIPFVNVIQKGTSNGTTSNMDGQFSLTVEKLPTTLSFSYLGYESQEIRVTNLSPLTISFIESAAALEEVVITGLATSVKRSNAANAVSSITSQELVGRASQPTLDGALAGKFAGALVTRNSGAPGGGVSVKLRGTTSVFGNAQPLYIVDGVYVDNSSISGAGLNFVSRAAAGGNTSTQDNPSNRIADLEANDIERVEVLKGASAGAIYGARAAAGVIIITTKRGRSGETKVSVQQEVGFNEIINFRGQRTFTSAIAENTFGEGQGALFTQAQQNGRLVDYEREVFGEEGFISNTYASISGGSDNTTFYGSFSNREEDGIVKNTGYAKKSARLNLTHDFFDDKMKLTVSTNYIDSESDRGFFNNDNSGSTIGVTLTSLPPWAQLFPNENGVYPDNPYGGSNPLQTIQLITNKEEVNRFVLGSTLDYNIFESERASLKAQFRFGLDYYQLQTRAFFPKELQFMDPDNGGVNGVSALGTTKNRNNNYSAFLVHTYFTENNTIFTTQGGVTRESFLQNTVNNVASDLIGSETNLDQAGNINVSQFQREQNDSGFFVQEEVNFQDKMIGTVGLRADKSSNFGDANELFYFPKASLAINLHNFDFWKDGVVSELKPRVAYGESGNFAPFGALFTTLIGNSIGGFPGIGVPATLGDSNIDPERQKELEFGFDASFFKKRVNLQASYYIKDVDDLILQAQNEPSSGFAQRFSNAGNLRNQGIELTLDADVVRNDDFTWSTNVIFFRNRSEITQLDVEPFNLGGFGTGLGTFRIEEGQSVTQIAGNDGNGNIVKLGDAEPDFQMTFTNNFTYKNFDLSFLWHWKEGGDNINLTTLLTDLGGVSPDYDAFTLDPSGQVRNGDFRINALQNGLPEPFIEDASYLRLREIALKYSVPENVIQNLFKGYVSNIELGITGLNLINIFDYNSYDPEVSNFGGNGLSTGVEVTPFPTSKQYLFRVKMDF
ncbi:SusC/RagA family TonB-linked outer membrane protein [Psychroflexus sp. CAK8W]|uniref:SusC/RagA family TonB-linked outer membrane protein n=1 Tax=Psychroflexus longus TaxID=2873596 RepID=A0ABS7XF78_9FLAO|nr:SusC/RagA family TonB-linked outer membrane protein [Psychroflexus longus]MBZ9777590.1 SusC/RagA family TonB-linked outer membrane protein [Psychroflexus longus]